MKRTVLATMAIAMLGAGGAWSAPAPGPADTPQLGSILKQAQKMRGLIITEGDEVKIGEGVSEKVRARYGVVQDPAVHRYVTLVGAVLTTSSSRPNLPWKFIVLDTDGVNAFAAPGGLIHITRGALGLVNDEAELAGVLAHEITHVTEKHTAKALQEGKLVEFGADATMRDKAVLNQIVEKTTEAVMAGFGRKEELESDREGLRLANKVGYDPHGLDRFLRRLSDRNKSASEKQGLFASHPEMKERIDSLDRQVTAEKLASTASLEPRYHKAISYTAKPQAEIAPVEAGAAGLAGGGKAAGKQEEPKQEEQPKKKGFGLSSLIKPSGTQSKSAEVTGSGASRGVDTERNAKGGANPALVIVKLNAGDIADFKKEGNLK